MGRRGRMGRMGRIRMGRMGQKIALIDTRVGATTIK